MLKKTFQLIRAFGLRWVLFRLRYALRLRTGALRRRTPQKSWYSVPSKFDPFSAEVCWKILFYTSIPPTQTLDPFPEANALLAGRFRLYGYHDRDLGRFPDWHRSPLDPAKSAPADKHWSEISDFAHGDIKNIWELSRWPWAFPLARAGYYSDDGLPFAERFWELAGDWMAKNPPNSGPNWKCGQEATFRLMAAVFARFLLDASPATTAKRLTAWRRLVRATGERIAANLDYALSQSNNHGVSECVGLLTAGSLVGGDIGKRWFARATKALQGQLAALVYPDGGFSQHSAVYHRVLLHDLFWARLAFEAAREEPPGWLDDADDRAIRFFAALVDTTGTAHLYGANDGANILPDCDCGFADFRSVVETPSATDRTNSTTPDDVSSESHKSHSEASPTPSHFPDSGVLVWQCRHLSLLLRCPSRFRHRATRDMGHLSVHWRGIPILLNPGSYSYNTTGPFAEGFSSAFVHNTATCAGADQMEKLGRFLYLPWPRGETRWLENGTAFEFVNLAYKDRFNATHTRRIRLRKGGAGFEVTDIFESSHPRPWHLHWLLADGEWRDTNDGADLRPAAPGAPLCSIRWKIPPDTEISKVRADDASVRGWHSPHYQDAQPAWSLAFALAPACKIEVKTVFAFDA